MYRVTPWSFILFVGVVLVSWSPWFTHASDDLVDKVGGYGLGRLATSEEIKAWDIDISPQGEGLPPGQGTVRDGAEIYATKCSSCHGTRGTEGPMQKLVGGRGTLLSNHPIKTVGSYWPYATTLFDYIYRAMPPAAPQSLSSKEVYAVVAWILYRNEIISESDVMNAKTLPAVNMPNRNGFVPDPRPDIPKKETP